MQFGSNRRADTLDLTTSRKARNLALEFAFAVAARAALLADRVAAVAFASVTMVDVNGDECMATRELPCQ